MFFDVFRELCDKKGVSPSRAALECGLSKSTVSQWKTRGSSPKFEQLSKIAAYFGVSVDYLLGNEEKPAVKSDALKNASELFQRIGNPLKNGIAKISNTKIQSDGTINMTFSIDESGLSASEVETIAAFLKKAVDSAMDAIDKLPIEGEVSDDELKHALFNGAPATDSQLDEVKRFAKYIADNGPLSKD